MSVDTLPWVEKYRPRDINNIFGHEYIMKSLKEFMATNQLPHLLFYGPPGTGKTTTALAIAHQLCDKHYSSLVLELNASDERGINVVRDTIKQFASVRTMFNNTTKLVILDESDKLTRDAQNALRRVLEQYSGNCRFIFICNEVYAIIPALHSRCAKFRFGPLEKGALKGIVQSIVHDEMMDVEDSAVDALIDISKGDARNILNTLQALKMTPGLVDEKKLFSIVGLPHPNQIIELMATLLSSEFKEGFDEVLKMINQGLALIDIISRVLPKINDPEFAQRFDKQERLLFITRMADIEVALSNGGNEKTQSAAFVSAFRLLTIKSPTLMEEIDV